MAKKIADAFERLKKRVRRPGRHRKKLNKRDRMKTAWG